MKDTTIYFNPQYIIPPLYNCMLSSLELVYDPATKYYKNINGVGLEPLDWGGIGGFQFGDIIPNHPAFTYFGDFINYLTRHGGYQLKKSIFGAPYDWRLGVNMPQSFWTNLSLLCQQAYSMNGNTPVVLVGHSLGGFMIQRFLTQHSTPEWRQQYIDSAILSAPSFGGSGLAFQSLVTGELPLLGVFISDRVKPAVRSIGALHAQMPNHPCNGNATLGYDTDGTPLTAADFPRVLERLGLIDKDIFDLSKNEPAVLPEQPDVPVAIVYNSEIQTVVGYDLKKKKAVNGRGDLVVLASGPEYACNNWVNSNMNNKRDPNTRARVNCYNFNTANPAYNHLGVTMLIDCVQKTMNYVLDDSWKN